MKILYAAYLIILIAACAAVGSVQPQDFGDKLASAYATTSAMRDTATRLLTLEKISSKEHKQITDQLATVRAGLDITRDMDRTNPKAADTKLTSLRTGLSALQGYLDSRIQQGEK